ncbi:hypothetical protein SNE40_014192 [Patella caerulea]|uniref:Endonuclease/exonuclease/phosphatase domain-containing protein n=1 Tax=Patella caerulea TaxID=87958 RepID=A0AAN8JHJ0_PATCE
MKSQGPNEAIINDVCRLQLSIFYLNCLMILTNIKISTWNIHGLNDSSGLSKIDDKEFINNYILKFDIICLMETWTNIDSRLSVKNYQHIHSFRKKNRRGGLIAYYKNGLSKGIEHVKSKSEDIIWLKLKKDFFKLDNDIFLSFVYCLPISSSLYEEGSQYDTIEILRNEITYLNPNCDIILSGDFNGRTGKNADFIENDSNSSHIPMYDNYSVDSCRPRFSKDKIKDHIK